MRTTDQQQSTPEATWWQSGIRLFLRLSGWVGGPILIGALIGMRLDAIYHTDPWFFLLGVGIAFIVSTIVLIRIGSREIEATGRQLNDPTKQNDSD